jgi:hypothetical protein
VTEVSQETELRYVRNRTAIYGGHVKKILGLGAAALVVPAAIASAALFSPGVAASDSGSMNSMNVVGEPYFKAVSILKSQGIQATFGGSFGSDLPQSQCIVSQQKSLKNRMILNLDCTQAAADHATDSAPATPTAAPGGPAPGNGQGTYGPQVGVPVPVGG